MAHKMNPMLHAATALPDQDPLLPSSAGVLALSEDWSPDLQKARVYEQILLDIILGELPPGARLDEQGLAPGGSSPRMMSSRICS